MAQLEPHDDLLAVRLTRDEATVIRRLLDEMIDLLALDARDDAIEERLFPRAYDDDADANKFRDMVGDDLRKEKLGNYNSMLNMLEEGGERLALLPKDVETWLRGLTDLRLALGTRLNVTEEKMADVPEPDDPDAAPLALLHWLGWLQEMMIDSLTTMEGDR